MTRFINSFRTTLQLIADILSFQNNEDSLRQQLHDTQIDWEALVTIASSHLVLTTVYCRLQQKQLLDLLPEDLDTYLNELTAINRNRNVTLLEEIRDISTVLDAHNINYVFLKGGALLAGGYYKDPGERMIGDIDILVAPNQIENAFELVSSLGYSKHISFNYEVENFRHLDRQVHEDKLAAIELHKTILNNKHRYLTDTNAILLNKNIVNGIAIPSQGDLIRSSILAQQINNNGHYYNSLNFKCVYDCLGLKIASDKPRLEKFLQERYMANFLGLSNVHFLEIEIYNKSFAMNLSRAYYKLTLNNRQLGKILFKIKYLFKNISERIHLIIFNSSYRRHILTNKIFKST